MDAQEHENVRRQAAAARLDCATMMRRCAELQSDNDARRKRLENAAVKYEAHRKGLAERRFRDPSPHGQAPSDALAML